MSYGSILSAPFRYAGLLNSMGRNSVGNFTGSYKRKKRYRRTTRRPLRRFRKKFRRTGRRKNGPEIKYTAVIEKALTAEPPVYGTAPTTSVGLIDEAWPSNGTSKNGRIGERIFIRKLVVTILWESTKENWEPCTRVVVVKSRRTLIVTEKNSDYFAGNNLYYPNMYSGNEWWKKIPLLVGVGQTIYDKVIPLPIPDAYPANWVAPAKYRKTWKKVFRINKTYEKMTTADSYFGDRKNYLLFNVCSEADEYGGTGTTGKISWYFTYTDC